MTDPLQLLWTMVQFKAALLVAVAVIVLGYLLKLVPQVDNARIPIYIILASVLFYCGLCVPPAEAFTGIDAFIRYAFATVILGAFVGLIAWLFHARLLKRLVDAKIPFLNQTDNDNKPTP